MKKNIDIECLRAVAIVLTMLLHLPTLLPSNSGFLEFLYKYFEFSVGVDLFFVVSGFVITQSLVASEHQGGIRTSRLMMAFWTKRAFRLLPAAFLWLIVLSLYYVYLGHFWEWSKPILAAALNLMNLYSAYCVENPTDPLFCGAFYQHGHYWSLSLEEQFYLVYPFLFFFIPRRFLMVLVVAAIAAQFFWNRPIWSYGWFFRTDALCWGVLLALLYHSDVFSKFDPQILRRRVVSIAMFIVLIVILVVVGRQFTGFSGNNKSYGVALVAVVGAVLVWLSSFDRNYFSCVGLMRDVMVYLGARSYSLYVSHLIIFMIIKNHFPIFNLFDFAEGSQGLKLWIAGVGVGLTFLAAESTYRWVELPIRTYGRNTARRLQAGEVDAGC